MRLARRDPSGASELVRRRLREKLGQVEGEIADLRTTQAGLVRALDDVWGSVPTSTSTAAYLVRAGHHPKLVPGEPLHVTDGESVASTLRRTFLGGVVLAWQDVLHEGPLATVPPDEFRALRAAFLAGHGWGDAAAIAEEMRRRDELLARALADGNPVLWFEHDLFDQLQLLQLLACFPDTAETVELVQAPRRRCGGCSRSGSRCRAPTGSCSKHCATGREPRSSCSTPTRSARKPPSRRRLVLPEALRAGRA